MVAAQLDRPLKQGSGRGEGGVQEQWGRRDTHKGGHNRNPYGYDGGYAWR
jgi:hypothetical protein